MSKTEIIKATIQYQHYQHIYPQKCQVEHDTVKTDRGTKTECKHLKAFTL